MNLATCIQMAQVVLAAKAEEARREGRFLAPTDIEEVVTELLAMPLFAAIVPDELKAALNERFTVLTAHHAALGNDDDHQVWLVPRRREEIQWRYWDRYRIHLSRSLPPSAVRSIDDVTSDILERLEDPERSGTWDRRGLVMGNVQSGKTANYCGLVCKAADAGYKVIIVLAGIHNSLRSQTQIRMEEGFLGFMNDTGGTQAFRSVGVGLIDNTIRANTGTGRGEKADFSKKVAKQFGIHPGGLPLLFVVKKNVTVLRNLISWIESCADAQETTGRRYVANVPALIIDDESDLASVDTKQQAFDEDGNPDEDHDPARTNECIRRLLRAFGKAAYVAYTATPFANIYIHDKGRTPDLGDDLFPRSFIVNIPPPSNYMGPSRIFGIQEDPDAGLEEVRPLPILRTVSDHADSDRIDETHGWMPPRLVNTTGHVPRYDGRRQIPPSLREALMAFLLATAVRRIRDPQPHFNSMLIHVVRFTRVQKEVTDQVQTALDAIEQRLRLGDGDRQPTMWEEFDSLYRRDFIPSSAACERLLGSGNYCLPSWDELRSRLPGIVAGVRIRTINGSAGDILDYETHREHGMDIIAIGGDKLSRGLTLEGLTVSYFLRASRMYDTLMQMGRWFGYREKYIDLCRLYTTAELIDWFAHIAAASEELRREFDYMVNVGATPKEYGLKVRSHPLLLVTSAVKMRNGTELNLSFSGDISETIIFHRDESWLQANFRATEEWLISLGGTQQTGGYTWQVDHGRILEFLQNYQSHPDAARADTALLARYIRAQIASGELLDWTVKLVSSGASEASRRPVAGRTIGLIRRAPFPETQRPNRYHIRRLVSPKDELTDLSPREHERALELTRDNWRKRAGAQTEDAEPAQPGAREARQARDKRKGLLLLYPLDPQVAGLDSVLPPVIGLAISFPNSETARTVSYTVNNVFTQTGGDNDSL